MSIIVHVIGGDPSVERMFVDEGFEVWAGNKNYQPDLVVFTGGTDISTALYCQGMEGAHEPDVARDMRELGQFFKYNNLGTPLVGICRGAQLLNVAMGGSMIQNLPALHTGYRRVHRTDGYVSRTDSDTESYTGYQMHEDHHQGMIPSDRGIILASDTVDGTAEVVFYEGSGLSDVLCFQAHPEWGHSATKRYFFELLEEYLDVAP